MQDADALRRAIATRRTHKKFSGDPVDRATVERLCDLARFAPMHRLSNPWRFYACDRDAVARLGQFLRASPQIAAWPNAEKGPRKLAKLVDHYFPQLGALIEVTWVRSDDELIDREDHAAVSAAVQNLLLGAAAESLASFWSSSAALRHPDALRWFGADPEKEGFVASVWLGGRVDDPAPPPREPLERVLTWC